MIHTRSHLLIPCLCGSQHFSIVSESSLWVWMRGILAGRDGSLEQKLGMWTTLYFVLFSIHQQERGLRVDRDFLCKQLKAVIRGTWCSEISQDPWSIHCLRYLMDFEIASHFMLCFCFQNFSLRVMLSGFSWAWEAFNLNQIILKELSYHALLNTSRLGATEKKTCVFITEGKPLWQQHFYR